MKPPYAISLNLTNNTPSIQTISIMNPNPENQGISGNAAQNSYSYNVTSEISNALTSSGFNYLTVVFSINGGIYQSITINYGSSINTLTKLVSALNSLGQSFFYITSSTVGNYIISCYSIATNGDSYYYSSISINPNYTTNSFIGKTTYGNLGTVIYDDGYDITNGVGVVSRINTANNFWINSVPNITDSAVNRAGVSSSNLPSFGFTVNGIGIFANVYSVTSKTVYIGIGTSISPLGVVLYINNIKYLQLRPSLIASSLNSQLGTSSTSALSQFWNIYPVSLNAGYNYILLNSSSGSQSNSSSFLSFEVYDNTPVEIATATSYSGLNLLFSSKDYSGNMI